MAIGDEMTGALGRFGWSDRDRRLKRFQVMA